MKQGVGPCERGLGSWMHGCEGAGTHGDGAGHGNRAQNDCGWARGVRPNADVCGHAPNASAPQAQ